MASNRSPGLRGIKFHGVRKMSYLIYLYAEGLSVAMATGIMMKSKFSFICFPYHTDASDEVS